MTTSPKTKTPSAVHRGPSSAALKAAEAPMTVKQILEAKNAPRNNPALSALQRVIIPAARARWMMPDLEWVTPDYISRVLSSALSGDCPAEEHSLYDLMCRTWPRLVKNVTELKNAVCDLVWTVQDPEDREDLKHLAERARDGMKGNYKEDGQGWRGTINGLLDGWFCGIAVREIDWEARGCAHMPQAWLPRQTRRVHPRWYGWHAENGLFGMRSPGCDALGDFDADKFLVAINNVSFGHPCGGALLRSLAWYWCAANFSADWLLSFAQIFGQPIRWGNYDASDPGLQDIMADMLENMGSAAWAAAPQGCTLELKEPSNKGSDNPQRQLIDLADMACDLLILGQILTGTPGEAGSRALGEVHYNVRSDIINAAAGWLAEILNEQLLGAVYKFNASGTGGEEAAWPYYDPSSKAVNDPIKAAERVKILLEAGVPLVKTWTHEVTETPQPGDDDEVYTRPEPSGQLSPSLVAKALEGMPAASREYFMAAFKSAASPL